MNIRKNIDYSEMYAALDEAMVSGKEQMELYIQIGQAVCLRTEKGAAVAAAEYLRKRYPDVQGFSPRNLRRMRDFCRTYENHPVLLSLAMQLSWTQNVVIMEADLTMELREWYLRAARQFGWSKSELISGIANSIHLEIILENEEEMCDNIQKVEDDVVSSSWETIPHFVWLFMMRQYLSNSMRRKPQRPTTSILKPAVSCVIYLRC